MTPLEYYHKKIAIGEILADQQQLAVMQQFEVMHQALTNEHRFFERLKKKMSPKGLYLWGSVGIGKTFLVDTFYYCLPFEEKLRSHFYAFMRQVHVDLKELQGERNPLQKLAKRWAAKVRVICLDELLIQDIADAVLLAGLVNALLNQGICLVFTTNVAPDDLYKNGLQRELFLPAIESIKTRLDVVRLDIVDDYRTHYRAAVTYYWYPLTAEAEKNMEKSFVHFSQGAATSFTALQVCHREIPIKKQAADVVWFEFRDICGIPRNQDDYLALTQQFHTILVSHLTAIAADDKDLARSFIRLVDVLYDAKVRLIVSASHPIDKIYTAGDLLFEFARTRSRLLQMQSGEYATLTASNKD